MTGQDDAGGGRTIVQVDVSAGDSAVAVFDGRRTVDVKYEF